MTDKDKKVDIVLCPCVKSEYCPIHSDKDRVEEVLHHIDNQLHLETQAALAFGWGHLTIDEYELHRDAHLRDIVYAKDKDGKPMLAILSENQKPPKQPYSEFGVGHIRRVIIEEEKDED